MKLTYKEFAHISSSLDNHFSWEYVLSSKRGQKTDGATRTHRNVNISEKLVTKNSTLF